MVQAGRQALDPEHLDARCGELDRQWQSVKPPANLDDCRGVRIGQREIFDNGSDTLDEQLYRGEGGRLGGCQSRRGRRAAERSETVLALARDPERLAASRQDVDP